MAKSDTNLAVVEGAEKPKRARSPAKPKAVYVVFQILDENGNAVSVSKDRVNLIGFTKSSDGVLAITESGKYPNAVYKRGFITDIDEAE